MSKIRPSATTIHTRIPYDLREAVAACARDASMGQSEFVRHALRLVTKCFSSAPSVQKASVKQLIDRSAAGDPLALSEMSRRALNVVPDSELQRRESLIIATVYAQLAAAHGDLSAVERLAAIQMVRADQAWKDGDQDLASTFGIEAVLNLESAANAGSERAAQELNSFAPGLPADVLEQARACAKPSRQS